MSAILAVLNAAVGDGRIGYVHCWEGRGRTGTVAWSWLVERGMTSAQALHRIRESRSHDPAMLKKDAPNWHQIRELESRHASRKSGNPKPHCQSPPAEKND